MQKIILIGFGFMGTMHAQIYQKLKKARIVAVVDNDTKKVRTSMKELGVKVPLFDSLDVALREVESDAVDICLPTDLHCKNAMTAIAAGKHLFCEKPLTLGLTEARRLIIAAKKAGVTAQVGQCIRFWPEYMAFKKFVESGQGGQLLSLSMQRRSSLPTHSVDQWILKTERSGGAALDLHIHDTDFIIYLLGVPQAVRSISPSFDGDLSQIFTQYSYKNVSVTAECGWNYPINWGFQMAFQAVFKNAAVEYDTGSSPSLTLTMGKGKKKPLPFKSPSIGSSSTGSGNISALGGYFNELQSFIRALEGKRTPETATLEDAAQSLEVTLAEIKSVKTGKQVRL